MEEQPLWIVEAVNAVLGKPVAALLGALGFHVSGPEVIPPHIVMTMFIVVLVTVVCAIMKPRLSVENPSKFQILLEDGVLGVQGLLVEWIGPEGKQYLPLIATFGIFILLGNYAGLVPGLVAPTANINVTVGCALTTWVFYHFQGIRKQGVLHYILHFAHPPGAPWAMAPLMNARASRTASSGSAPRASAAVIAAENTQPLPCVLAVSMRSTRSSTRSWPSQ